MPSRDRDRIDWENLAPLPRKKRNDGMTRDDLANRKFHARKARNKGRNHITNQKRRQIAKEQANEARMMDEKKMANFRALKARIRAFWLGEIEEHP